MDSDVSCVTITTRIPGDERFIMSTIRAIYEDGVFRPTGEVDLPEPCTVEFEPRPVGDDTRSKPAITAVYEVLSERYQSGETDVAARHNEHQP